MDLGFLGLGQMGSAIAERLEQRGARLHVFDPSEKAMAPFLERGAIRGESPADFTSLIKVLEGWAGVEVRRRT